MTHKSQGESVAALRPRCVLQSGQEFEKGPRSPCFDRVLPSQHERTLIVLCLYDRVSIGSTEEMRVYVLWRAICVDVRVAAEGKTTFARVGDDIASQRDVLCM